MPISRSPTRMIGLSPSLNSAALQTSRSCIRQPFLGSALPPPPLVRFSGFWVPIFGGRGGRAVVSAEKMSRSAPARPKLLAWKRSKVFFGLVRNCEMTGPAASGERTTPGTDRLGIGLDQLFEVSHNALIIE